LLNPYKAKIFSVMSDSIHYNNMMQCLLMASQGAGYVSPNPMVGAMLVHQGRMIGAGYHMQYGEAHAEVNCINSVAAEHKHLIPSSILYISLEPCSHTGNTPPCTQAIIENGIKKVVIGSLDNNPVATGGAIILQQHGIEVISNVAHKECMAINRRFYTYHTLARPYIILKWAQSADGFVAQAGSKTQLSNPQVNEVVHTWRTQEDAILVGYNTALIDNPQLNVRHIQGRNPVRLVWDAQAQLPPHLNVFDNSQATIIFNNTTTKQEALTAWAKAQSVQQIIEVLYRNKTLSIIVEGGPKTIQQFLDAQLWDEARVITTPHHLHTGIQANTLINEQYLYSDTKGDNQIIYFKNKLNPFI
jgi:diaminohydroxyphosphoribosylaminopyrimidine deaminase / 5-amino-6-(5-phosphoribosylamino)uracil reductase